MKKKLWVLLLTAILLVPLLTLGRVEAKSLTYQVSTVKKGGVQEDCNGYTLWFSDSATKNPCEWVKSGGKWYLKNTKTKKYVKDSFVLVDGKHYYLDAKGVMKTGNFTKTFSWSSYKETFHADSNGALKGGWLGKKYSKSGWVAHDVFLRIGGKKYYFAWNQEYITGLTVFNGKSAYYADGKGVITEKKYVQIPDAKTGKNRPFYCTEGGKIKNGWNTYNGKVVYTYTNYGGVGYSVGWLQTGGKMYYLNANGEMLTGWQTINGKRCYLEENSNNGTVNGKSLAAAKCKCIDNIGGKEYVFDKNCYLMTGLLVDPLGSAGIYYTDSTGAIQKDLKWLKLSGKYYYITKDGSGYRDIVTEIDKKVYGFDSKGVMQTKWFKWLGYKWFYFDGEGAATLGWKKLGGYWYYFAPSKMTIGSTIFSKGQMLASTSKKIGNKTYNFNEDGHCTNP